MSNPYPYACSRLCNHPVDSEARREYLEAVRKAGKDTGLGSGDIGFLVNGEEEQTDKRQQEESAQQPVPRPVILDSVPAVVEALMPTLAVASASRSEGAAGAKQRSSRRRNLEARSCPPLQSAPQFPFSVWYSVELIWLLCIAVHVFRYLLPGS